MGHSRFSPSSTDREVECPASFLLNEGLPNEQTPDASHGTAAHFVGALCLSKNVDMDHYAGCRIAVDEKGNERFLTENKPLREGEMEWEVDDEMVDNVQRYVDWCRELPGEHFVEVVVEHTDWCPDVDENGDPLDPQFGTSDHVACIPAGSGLYDESTLVVSDLKYGRGVKVFAKKNRQAIKYALGTWKELNWLYGFKRIVIRICQPRLGHFDVWELPVEELLQHGQDIKARLSLVWDEDAPFGPGEKACKFCKVKRCKARQKFLFEQAVMMLDEDTGEMVSDPRLMNDDELLEAYRLLPLLEIHVNQIRSAVHSGLMTGHEIGEHFLVESNTHRAWFKPLPEVQETLRKAGVPIDDMWKKTFVSPAQAESLLPRTNKHGGHRLTKKERAAMIAELAKAPPGYPVIAEPGDKRKRYVKPEIDLEGLD